MNDRPTTTTRSPLNGRTLLIGLIVVVAALFLIPRLFNTNQTPTTTTVDQPQTIPQTDPNAQTDPNNQLDPNVNLGQVVSSNSVDRDGCAVGTRSTFEPNESIYVVTQGSDIPSGTSVFVRLSKDGQAIEDAPEITADRDYNNSCVNFVFDPDGSAFDPGQYEAEFIVNGNPADTISFDVR